jgi:putative hydrolase of the HAD superfamily
MFDLGNTVLCGSFNPIQGNKALLDNAYNPRQITADQIQEVADKLDKEISPLKETTNLESTTIAFQKYLYDYFEIEIKYTPIEAELIFWDASFDMKPTYGIESILQYLQKVNISCSIISNMSFSGSLIAHELKKHDLLHFFHHIICSSDYGFRKPSKRIFEIALIKEKILPNEAWFIGDSIESDIYGARNAGLYPIWYNPDHKAKPEGQIVNEISKWEELKENIKSGAITCG